MIIIRILELPLLRGFTLILLSIMPKLAEKKKIHLVRIFTHLIPYLKKLAKSKIH